MTKDEFLVWARRFPEGLMLVARDGRIAAANPALLDLLQLPAGALAGRTLFDVTRTSPDLVRAALRLWSGSGQMLSAPATFALDGVGTVRCEGALVTPGSNGAATLVVRVRRHEAAAERFVTLNATIEQLTRELYARKQSEETIRVQREWLHVTLSSIGDAVIATDVQGNVEFMNAPAEQLTGWRMQDARGQPMSSVFEIFNEQTREPAENPVTRVLSDGVVVGLANHTILRSKDGTERPIEDSAAPIRAPDGRLIGVVLVFHDVTEKKKAQAELVASERRFRLWTELNVIAAGVADLVGTFVEANDALLTLLGFTREDLRAGRVKWRDLTPPDQLARDERAIAEAKARGACHPYEKEYVLADGRRVPVIIGYALFRAPNRYPHQQSDDLAICYIVDISERKRAEELLERRVEERTARLKAAVADLETFSYTISHDLRAPLRSMQSYSQVLLEDYGPALPDEAKRYLGRIVHSGEHLDRLIHDVLTYARVSRGQHELQAVDVRQLLADLVERYPNFSAAHVRIDVSDTIPPVRGNEALLTQCFSNLIGNAVKFVPPGQAPHVKIWGERRDGRVRVSVQDNGIGIAAADLDRIFGIFERVHGASAYEGTGIGLSVVRRAVERMAGSVGVESTPGAGSRFWIELEEARS